MMVLVLTALLEYLVHRHGDCSIRVFRSLQRKRVQTSNTPAAFKTACIHDGLHCIGIFCRMATVFS